MNLLTALARLLIFPGLALRRSRRMVLPLGRTQSRRADAGSASVRRSCSPSSTSSSCSAKSTPPRRGIGGLLMRAWPLIAVSAAAGAVGLLPVLPSSGGFRGRPDPAARAARMPSHLHHRRGLLIALHLRRNRLGARSRPQRLLQHRLSAGHRLHRRLAAHLPARSAGRSCPPLRCAGWACSRFWSACPPSCTSIPSRCPTPSRKSTPAR